MIMKCDGKTAIQDLPDDFKPDPLGDADQLRNQLADFFGGVNWDDPAWGILEGDGFSFEFNFTKSGTVDTFTLHVRGGGDAVTPIVEMCKHFGWQALDYSTGDFIDLKSPTSESWQRFQEFRDRVISTYRDSPDSQGT